MHFSHNPMHYLHIASHCNLYHVDDPLKKSFDATPNTSGILLFCLGISEARVKNLQRNIRHIFLSRDVGAFKFQFRMRGSSQRSGQLEFFFQAIKISFCVFYVRKASSSFLLHWSQPYSLNDASFYCSAHKRSIKTTSGNRLFACLLFGLLSLLMGNTAVK